MLEREDLGLGLLGDIQVDKPPYLKAVVIIHAVIDVPGLSHQVGVQEAEQVERQHPRVVADMLELRRIPRLLRGVGSDDLSLLLNPLQEWLDIRALVGQEVSDLFAPQVAFVLAVELWELVPVLRLERRSRLPLKRAAVIAGSGSSVAVDVEALQRWRAGLPGMMASFIVLLPL